MELMEKWFRVILVMYSGYNMSSGVLYPLLFV